MSHMAAIALHVTDLSALKEAVEALGLQIKKAQTWKWFGSWQNDYHATEAAFNFGIKPNEYGKCAEYVISIPGNSHAYEVGVVRRRDGKPGWVLVYDFWAGGQGMSEKISGPTKPAGLLVQAYTIAESAKTLRAEGHKVQVKKNHKTGHMQCVAVDKKTLSHKRGV